MGQSGRNLSCEEKIFIFKHPFLLYHYKLCRRNKVMAPLKTPPKSGLSFQKKGSHPGGGKCSRCLLKRNVLPSKKGWEQLQGRGTWNWMASSVPLGVVWEGALPVAAESVNEVFNTCAGTNSCTENWQLACRSSEHNLKGNFLRLEKGNEFRK